MQTQTAEQPVVAVPAGISALRLSGARLHLPFFYLVTIYLMLAIMTLDYSVGDFLSSLAVSLVFGTPMLLLAVFVMRFVWLASTTRPERPLKVLLQDIWRLSTCPERSSLGWPSIVLLLSLMTILGTFKSAVPSFGGFTWDATFAEWDRILHFGRHPWEWLQPVLGYPPITFAINLVYNFWMLSMWMVFCAWAFMTRSSIERTRFLLAFMLVWSIGGSLLAILLASAGPCFYSRIGLSPVPYAGLMAYFQSANEVLPIWALDAQNILWQGFNGTTVLDGITAMPSMHNASALLFFLASRQLGNWPRRLLGAQVVIVYLGSIHLGWHYAIDAYVAWAVTLACWFVSKPLAEMWEWHHPATSHNAMAEAFVPTPR